MGHMIPFVVSEAIRRARRRRPAASSTPAPRRPVRPLWRLVAEELAHTLRASAVRPAAAVALSGLATAAGVLVALGPGYPGPVAPAIARWVMATLVLVATVGIARAAPRRWREVGRTSAALVALAAAGAVSIVKVGLHDLTPGPVLAVELRWAAVALIAVVAALGLRRGGAPRG